MVRPDEPRHGLLLPTIYVDACASPVPIPQPISLPGTTSPTSYHSPYPHRSALVNFGSVPFLLSFHLSLSIALVPFFPLSCKKETARDWGETGKSETGSSWYFFPPLTKQPSPPPSSPPTISVIKSSGEFVIKDPPSRPHSKRPRCTKP
jgi:hypothetical protein